MGGNIHYLGILLYTDWTRNENIPYLKPHGHVGVKGDVIDEKRCIIWDLLTPISELYLSHLRNFPQCVRFMAFEIGLVRPHLSSKKDFLRAIALDGGV